MVRNVLIDDSIHDQRFLYSKEYSKNANTGQEKLEPHAPVSPHGFVDTIYQFHFHIRILDLIGAPFRRFSRLYFFLRGKEMDHAITSLGHGNIHTGAEFLASFTTLAGRRVILNIAA